MACIYTQNQDLRCYDFKKCEFIQCYTGYNKWEQYIQMYVCIIYFIV